MNTTVGYDAEPRHVHGSVTAAKHWAGYGWFKPPFAERVRRHSPAGFLERRGKPVSIEVPTVMTLAHPDGVRT
jgi:hypothetical protein